LLNRPLPVPHAATVKKKPCPATPASGFTNANIATRYSNPKTATAVFSAPMAMCHVRPFSGEKIVEICHANHTHRNSRHHTDVHHQHAEKKDIKQTWD